MGTMLKFNPLTENTTDTIKIHGVSRIISTRQRYQCITAMKEYEHKSLEELRFEDYRRYKTYADTTGTIIKFNPPTERISDTINILGVSWTTNILERYQCITAMKEYEHKSLEELRFEDYRRYKVYSGILGTTFKFNPPESSDTMLCGGVTVNISTRYQCITAMKEYEQKSLEELRLEDYRKTYGPRFNSIDAVLKMRKSDDRCENQKKSPSKDPGLFNPTDIQSKESSIRPPTPTDAVGTHVSSEKAGNCDSSSADLLRCIICIDKERSIVFRPCGHLIVCSNCANNFKSTCPMCRKPINEKIKAYIN